MAPRPGALALVAALAGVAWAAGAPGQAPDIALGHRVFSDNCAICHGETGDGRGHAADHFQHKPRDLTKGRFKFRSTASGQLPTDDDLRRTIVAGLPGTGMLPHDHLTEAELAAVLAFVKSLSPRFAAGPPARPLALPPATPGGPDAVARGQRAYVRGQCAECHGTAARGDGPSARDLSVPPTDLTRRPLKSGPAARDIARTLFTGLDGTPMPSYHQVLEDDEVWDLAHWVAAIGGPRELTPDERAGAHVVMMHQRRRR